MHAFESLMGTIFGHLGYWTCNNVKVILSPDEKRVIDRPTSPRWDIDLVAYKPRTNELLAIECKSLLDSAGVVFRHGSFEPMKKYKLFTEAPTREIVLNSLANQLFEAGRTQKKIRPVLCLAAANIAKRTDRDSMWREFGANGWKLFDETWIKEKLRKIGEHKYQDDLAFFVAKLLKE